MNFRNPSQRQIKAEGRKFKRMRIWLGGIQIQGMAKESNWTSTDIPAKLGNPIIWLLVIDSVKQCIQMASIFNNSQYHPYI